MIYDSIILMDKYFTNSKTWDIISSFVKGIDSSSPVGQYDVCDGVFAIISRYSTKPTLGSEMEVHQKYTDVQYLLSGSELIGYQLATSDLTETKPFNKLKDIGFFKSTQYGTVLLKPGVFALFPAGEFHMPQLEIAKGQSEEVIKVVIKIENDLLI